MRKWLAILFFLPTHVSAVVLVSCPVLPQLDSLATMLSDGKAILYTDGIDYIPVELSDGSGGMQEGCVTLFHLGGWGGGNTNRQYLAVFAKNESGNGFRLVDFALVGEKFDGALRIDEARPGLLKVTILRRTLSSVTEKRRSILITTRKLEWSDPER